MSGDHDRRPWIRHLLLLGFGVGLVALYIVFANTDRVLDRVWQIQTRTLLLAGTLALLAYLPRVWSLWSLSRRSDRPLTMSESLRAGCGSNALNLLLPARLGDVATITSLSRNRPSPAASALVFAWRALSFLALLALWAAFLLFALAENSTSHAVLAGTLTLGVLGSVSGAYAVGWMVHRGTPIGKGVVDKLRRFRRVESLIDWVTSFLRRGLSVFSPRATVLPAAALCLVWILDIGVAAVFILDLVPEVSFSVAFIAPIVANLSKLVRLTPGGIGIYEGVLSGMLVAAGGDLTAAVAAAAFGHAFLNVLMLVLGAVPAYLVGHRTSLSLTEATNRFMKEAGPSASSSEPE